MNRVCPLKKGALIVSLGNIRWTTWLKRVGIDRHTRPGVTEFTARAQPTPSSYYGLKVTTESDVKECWAI